MPYSEKTKMKLKSGQNLYYDKMLDRTLEASRFLEKNGEQQPFFIYNRLNSSKVFLIDEMTLDNFYNIPHGNMNYEKAVRLPFPSIFFEFEKGIDITLPHGNKKNLRALLHSGFIDFNESKKVSTKHYDFSKHMDTYLFFNESALSWPVNFLSYSVGNLPDFLYNSPEGMYRVKNNLTDVIYDAIKKDSEVMPVELDTGDFPKIIDLSLNLVSYINAQNTVIKRWSPDLNKMKKINKKRLKKGKSEIRIPTPYSWVEVKKNYYDSCQDSNKNDEKSWELKYRVWNRGHFRHYSDGKCIWIPPYIKGPEDAPWKENRYAALYKNFRHLLASRGDERD